MKTDLVTDASRWNASLLALPQAHVLQSWQWGQVKSQHNWRPTRVLWEQSGEIAAAAQVLRRPIPHTPWGIMYVPKGPVLDYSNPELVNQVLEHLEALAHQERAIFVKIDPDVELETQAAPTTGHPVVQQLDRRGWRASSQQIQFRNTALLDLTPPQKDLLSRMKSKTRYNIRLAQRKDIVVEAGSLQDIPLFYSMYAETGERDNFLIRPLAYYQDTWDTFLRSGLAHMLLAKTTDTKETIAGMILFRFGNACWYMYGASTVQHRNRMPNYALQWAAICWAKERGCTRYDMWGAPDTLDESDSLWGVWRFKAGLGARFVPHIGAYDYVTRPLLYWIYEVAVPRYLARLRHLRDRREN